MPAMMHASLPHAPCQRPTPTPGDTHEFGGTAWEPIAHTMAVLPVPQAAGTWLTPGHGVASTVVAVDPDDDEEDLGDEEDLTVAQPAADDESSFDDFDDEFDDDFEEEENDPDWDHPDEGDAEPPPGKPPARRK